MESEAELLHKRMKNDQFLKLFSRENDRKKPHCYQFAICYDLLTGHQKWSSNNAKSLRDVQSKQMGKKNVSMSTYNSSPGNSLGMDSNVGPKNEVNEAEAEMDEDARSMGQRASKKRIAIQVQMILE